jgi:hypothetical protein
MPTDCVELSSDGTGFTATFTISNQPFGATVRIEVVDAANTPQPDVQVFCNTVPPATNASCTFTFSGVFPRLGGTVTVSAGD